MPTSTLLNVFHVFSGAGATLSAFWHVLADPPCSKYAFLQCYQDLGLLKVCIFTVLLRQVSLPDVTYVLRNGVGFDKTRSVVFLFVS